MATFHTFMGVFFSLYSFANEFWGFLTSTINDYFSIDLGSFGEVTGLHMFFGAGIVVILAVFLVNLFIPN